MKLTKSGGWKSGFTLIELMVVVTIMGVLILGGIAAYVDMNKKQRLRQSAYQVATILNTAKKNADRGEMPSGCSALKGYVVDGVGGTTSIQVGAWCQNATLEMVGPQTVDLTNNTKIVSWPGDMVFRTLSQGTTDTNLVAFASYPLVISLQLTEDTSKTLYVKISRWGAVSVTETP